MKSWFVVRLKTGAESRAAWHLNNQGFDVYLPQYRKEISPRARNANGSAPRISWIFVCQYECETTTLARHQRHNGRYWFGSI